MTNLEVFTIIQILLLSLIWINTRPLLNRNTETLIIDEYDMDRYDDDLISEYEENRDNYIFF